MATETLAVTWNASDVVTLKAGADLTGAYGKIVKLDSTEGQVVVATSMTESTDVGGYMGVVVKPPSGTATGLPVGIVSRAGLIVEVLAAGAIADTDYVGATTAGKASATPPADGELVLGVAMTTTAADGEYLKVMLSGPGATMGV